ncbi:MAG: Calx-beta domain-containing protein, partial [Planctomycetota bacterium]
DYSAASAHVVQWADGDHTAKTVTIPIIDNALPGSSRSFDVFLGVVYGLAQTGTLYQTHVTITDDDAVPAGIIGFASSTTAIASTASQATLTLHRSGGTSGSVSVSWATVFDYPQSARPFVDVTPSSGTVTWANLDSADKTINVPLIDDGNPGPDRTFIVQLASPTGGSVLDVGSALDAVTITLIEADVNTAGIIACAHASQTTLRSATTADVIIQRSGGSTGAISVNYHTVANTALNGVDFAPTYGTLIWTNGDSANKTISVPLLSVSSGLPDTLFTVHLDQPAGGADLGQTDDVITLTDPPAPGSSSTTGPPSASGSGGCGGSIAGVLLLCMAGFRSGRGRTARRVPASAPTPAS